MDERLKTNVDCWNEMAHVHLNSPNYRVKEFREGKIHLTRLEREEVGDVRDKSLLHLQCHFGLDTMSWARLGARATGLDFSDQAIDIARSLSNELEIPAKFGSDLAVAKALLVAAKAGVMENVKINLDSIQDAGFKEKVEERIRAAG